LCNKLIIIFSIKNKSIFMKPSLPLLKVFLSVILLSFITTDIFSQVTRGAYLQMGHQTGITIRWQTSAASDSRVRIGTSYMATGLYATVIDVPASVTEHIITLSGLTPDTKYFYSIGTTAAVQQVSANNFFTTAPPANTTRKIRIAAFGDCGQESSAVNQTASLGAYQTYLTNNGVDAADAWLLLGDNAYNVGNATEYTNKFFTPYAGSTNNILRNHKLFPSPGNHEYNNSQATADRIRRDWHYFSAFTLPQNGECGGTASTKPNFYSFDIGNVHFLSLDSHGMESTDGNSEMGTNSATTVMKNWIDADLAANTKKWVVAYWHHPPYSKGSHNSDTETQMINIRTRFVRFLEQRGVDMIISGHSHAYERSYLIKNFLTNWTTFTPATHAVSSATAKYDGTVGGAPYKYNSTPLDHGTVYVVAGNAGANNSSISGFGANGFPWAIATPGVFYFEVEDNRLDAKMIRSNNTIFDQFTMMKDVNKTTVYNITIGQSQMLNASWPAANGTYVWTGSGASGTNRSTTVTPATTGSFVYTVADNNNGGLLDQFTVNVSGTLPVTFTKFTAQKTGAGVAIKWTVAEVINHDYFSIERSTDGIQFTEINRNNENINGQGNRSFSINDINLPPAAILYYRIRQCDIGGVCKYTEVKTVRVDEKNKFVLYPVPAGNSVNILYTSTNANAVTINIVDQHGGVMINEIRKVTTGVNNIQLDITKLAKGNYIVTVNDGKEKLTEKLIKL
jgi:hypothetical protein